MHNAFVEHCSPLHPVESEAYDRLYVQRFAALDEAKRKFDQLMLADYCDWLVFRDLRVTGSDDRTYIIEAGYTKDTDGEGYYHWRVRISIPLSVGITEVVEKHEGQFKTRKRAKDAAWKALEKYGKQYSRKQRKTRKTSKPAQKREHDADGNPVLTDAEKRAVQKANAALNRAFIGKHKK